MRKHSRFDLALWFSILFLGVACMVVAGWFLIQGFSAFGGATAVWVAAAILFQCCEVYLFLLAGTDVFGAHSRQARLGFFSLGSGLFLFSIFVMTMAQSSSMQSGVLEAQAIDNQRTRLEQQLASLNSVIGSYRANADKQSQSVYAQSRALGQDSINRAAELEEKKLAILDKLSALDRERQETSQDFFSRVEAVVGIPKEKAEFWFLVIRSLFFEILGIVFLNKGVGLISGYFRPIESASVVRATERVLGAERAPEPPPVAALGVSVPLSSDSSSAPGKSPDSAQVSSGDGSVANGPGPVRPEAGEGASVAGPSEKPPGAKRKAKLKRLAAPVMKSDKVVPFKSSEPINNADLSIDELAEKILLAEETGEIKDLKWSTIKSFLSVGSSRVTKVRDAVMAAKNKRKSETSET